MTIDLDAYSFAAISLTWNGPVTNMPFASRLIAHVLIITYLSIKILGKNFHVRMKRAALTLGALLFKQCLTCFDLSGNNSLQLRQPQNHKISRRAPIIALYLHSQ